ncbi:MAG: Ni/Fe hydrogenase subunit alpha [Gammaproteobacteria bacterium]|nr:MAG: Ni/Fe hydrogenase subunit alpha [Gammaproteobacteria bacterium]
MTEQRYRHLEQASGKTGLRRVAIDPLTRVEGHGKVTLLLDEENRVQQARLHIVEFRGFEKFIQGRPYWEVPVLVQRLCGICPVSHLLAGAKAIDDLMGATGIPPTAEKLRRLLHYGQVLQSHALHFFHLASPDLLFGPESQPALRNVMAELEGERSREIALMGIRLRRFGQEVIRHIIGKRIHGTGPLPGGMNRHLDREAGRELQEELPQVLAWAGQGVDLARRLILADPGEHRRFATVPSLFLALTGPNGAHELYDGLLRVRDEKGGLLYDGLEPRRYREYLREQVKRWSYMKFPYLSHLGPELGWYRVGPLARLNVCDHFGTEQAERQRRRFFELMGPPPVQATLAYHWARMIEILHCAERIEELLRDEDLYRGELLCETSRGEEGVGVIEAPRGVLIHHYRVDEQGLVTGANLIVSTTHNNTAMNESLRQVAAEYLDGREFDELLLNRIEMAIRAYDPCLSCATHAIGKMPLELVLEAPDGSERGRLLRHADGTVVQG